MHQFVSFVNSMSCVMYVFCLYKKLSTHNNVAWVVKSCLKSQCPLGENCFKITIDKEIKGI